MTQTHKTCHSLTRKRYAATQCLISWGIWCVGGCCFQSVANPFPTSRHILQTLCHLFSLKRRAFFHQFCTSESSQHITDSVYTETNKLCERLRSVSIRLADLQKDHKIVSEDFGYVDFIHQLEFAAANVIRMVIFGVRWTSISDLEYLSLADAQKAYVVVVSPSFSRDGH